MVTDEMLTEETVKMMKEVEEARVFYSTPAWVKIRDTERLSP